MTGCAGAADNTNACRELLNIEGELSNLVNTSDTSDDELAEVLPDYLKLAEEARDVDADGAVKSVASSLGTVAEDFHDALEVIVQDSTLTGPVDSSILDAYIDASIDMRSVCGESLP